MTKFLWILWFRELFLNTGELSHAQKYWRLQTFRAITGNIMFMEIG